MNFSQAFDNFWKKNNEDEFVSNNLNVQLGDDFDLKQKNSYESSSTESDTDSDSSNNDYSYASSIHESESSEGGNIDNQQLTTLAEQTFKQILDKHNGICPIFEMYKLFQTVEPEKVSETLHSLPYVRLIKKKNIEFSVIFRRSMILCSGHVGPNPCSKPHCRYIHLCKNILMGSCRYDSNCKLNHDVFTPHNRAIIRREELGSLNSDQILTVIKLSMPKICEGYINNSCKYADCADVHICDKMINYGKKHDQTGCNLSHDYNHSSVTRIFASHKLSSYTGQMRRRLILSSTNVPYKKVGTTEIKRKKNKPVWEKSDQKLQKKTKKVSKKKNRNFLEWLIKAKKGSCSLEEVQEFSSDMRVKENARKLFSEYQDRLLFLPTNLSSDCSSIVIKIFYPELKFCAKYAHNNCTQDKCHMIHVCEAWLNDACTRDKCPRNHNFNHSCTMKLKSKLGLDQGYSDSDISSIIRNSFPSLCVSYNKAKCIEGATCPHLHLCSDFLLNRAHNKCSKDHIKTSSSSKKILDFYRLSHIESIRSTGAILIPKSLWREGRKGPATKKASKDQEKDESVKDQNFGRMLSAIKQLEVDEKPIVSKGAKKIRSRSRGPPIKQALSTHMDNTLEKLALAQEQNTCLESSRDNSIEKNIIRWLIKENDGQAKLHTVLQSPFLAEVSQPQDWLKERKNLMVFIGSDPDSRTVQVSFTGCRLCINYLNSTKICTRKDCVFLHLCRDFVMDNCDRGNCKMSHNLADSHNSKILNQIDLSSYNARLIKMIIRNSMPQLCIRYSTAECAKKNDCPHIHVCPSIFNLQKDTCKKHEQDLDSYHNKRLFDLYKISKESCNESMRKRLILFPNIVTRKSSCRN